MKMKIDQAIKKANKAESALDAACSEVLDCIRKMVSFDEDFSVFVQAGDGLVLLWGDKNIPISFIVDHYKQKGILYSEDLLTHSI